MNFKNIFRRTNGKTKEVQADLPITLKQVEDVIAKRTTVADEEFARGYDLIKKYPRSVSILGSAKFKEDSLYYQQARSLSGRIAKELGYAVVTGGGPGIMEAANRGAYEAGGVSLGFAIRLPNEQAVNKYLTEYVKFEYFFSRKTLLFFSAESYVYYPGGFGTMDEFFEIVTLVETKKIPRVPVILIGRDFWTPILDLIKTRLYDEFHTIKTEDLDIYKIVDSEDEVLEIIKNAPFRTETE